MMVMKSNAKIEIFQVERSSGATCRRVTRFSHGSVCLRSLRLCRAELLAKRKATQWHIEVEITTITNLIQLYLYRIKRAGVIRCQF